MTHVVSCSLILACLSRPLGAALVSVGRYALQFDWSDGHDPGTYTFEYLRQLHDARGA